MPVKLPDWNLAQIKAGVYRITPRPEALRHWTDVAVNAAIETLRRRMAAVGLAASTIRRDESGGGCCNILMRVPGFDDPTRVKTLILAVASFRVAKVLDGPFPRQNEALAAHQGVLPADTSLLRGAGSETVGWYLVNNAPLVTSRDIKDAVAQAPSFRLWTASVTVSADGARNLAALQEGNRVAIAMDDVALLVPVVRGALTDSFLIEAFASREEAYDFAVLLRSGELPASLVIETENVER